MKNKDTLRKVLRYIKKYIWLLILSMLLALLTVAGALYIPIIIGQAIDLLVPGQAPGSSSVTQNTVDLAAVLSLLIQVGAVAGITALLPWLMEQ